MKYRLIASLLVVAALAGLALVLEPQQSRATAPATSTASPAPAGSDDASLKTLRIP